MEEWTGLFRLRIWTGWLVLVVNAVMNIRIP